jgi:hypothetical protein
MSPERLKEIEAIYEAMLEYGWWKKSGLLVDVRHALAALREENAELRANALDWKRWPRDRPDDDEPKKRLAMDDDGTSYLVKTSPKHWSKGNSFYWAEIPRPEGCDEGHRTGKTSQAVSRMERIDR